MAENKRFQSIYWRQFALIAGMVLLTLLLLGTSFFALTYTYIMTEKKDEMMEKAELMAELSATYADDFRVPGYWGNEGEGMRLLARVASSLSNIDFLIWDTQTNTLLTTDTTLEGQEMALPSAITKRVMAGKNYSGMSSLNIYPGNKYVVAVPIYAEDSEEIQGMVIAATETQSLTEMWRAFLGIFGMTSFTVLLIAFVASSVTARQHAKPIQEMAAATRRFAEGNFDARVQNPGRNDELGELAEAFNAMAESLQQTERQRQDFVANISHELKTPMTTITGYADGILDGTIPHERAGQYLAIISDESRRLSRLVRRMLEVSRLQTNDMLREKRAFDICESSRRVLISMEKKITDRGLDVEADIPEEPILVLGDNDLITQVIYNLLENAAKFATPGSDLYLGLAIKADKAEVCVRNAGPTIAPEDLPKLFERFHKADKARSEDKDGVGLGLYIVKTILEQHHEQIRVTSEFGLTTFTFTMALAAEGKMAAKSPYERG